MKVSWPKHVAALFCYLAEREPLWGIGMVVLWIVTKVTGFQDVLSFRVAAIVVLLAFPLAGAVLRKAFGLTPPYVRVNVASRLRPAWIALALIGAILLLLVR